METRAHLRLFILFIVVSTYTLVSAEDDRRTYIVHMDKSARPGHFSSHHDWYMSTLSTLSSPEETEPTHLYTYNHVLSGFSAVLSESQLAKLAELPGHLATYPETFGEGHTTHTPKFLGLKKKSGLWPRANFGEGMIVGVVDSGIWPESDSFRDRGMPPVPDRWKGTCESGVEFNSSLCNLKLIGARSFSQGMKRRGLNISTTDDYDSPRDYWGHGSHTSSTAAGSPVKDTNYFGYAEGTASGIAPLAHLAMYKVLFLNTSYDAAATDTLAAIDRAIEDGVDILSLSLSFTETSFDQNPVAIGAFAAMQRGIFVACSAGNAGPHAYTMHNGAPWLTTVGAGTFDRELGAHVTLGIGNGSFTIPGKSIFPENLLISRLPLYFGHGNRSKELCEDYSLDPKEVEGKIVFCDYSAENDGTNPSEIIRAGAAGAIFSTEEGRILKPEDFTTPYVAVIPKFGNKIRRYIKHSKDPVVSIKFQVTFLGVEPNPEVMWFSSRGPGREALWVLKPDIIAPGVDVLAAWTPNRGIAPIGDDYHFLLSDYALQSGTSMSAPHVAGVGALLKSAHPDWSPAAIRSAMMTTAYILDNTGGPIIDVTTGVAATPLDYGSGHIDPNRAMDPGLIYDMEPEDYIEFLCGMNYTTKQIRVITGRSNFTRCTPSLDLNYPSFILILNNTNATSFTFKRVLTNVADSASSYQATVTSPLGMRITVEPEKLVFPQKNSKASFTMAVEISLGTLESVSPQSDYIGNYGFLSWHEINGTHVVRSPIVSAFGP
ncbi:subtilisin-like protease SBT3 [Punica granatum]|uniref:Uncharacterized protein n=2 Tax=Punica granatum TaxID=22663 RepID=A0A218XG66_PUNGR|nr:subtilisin-like protease SBT3 [Punica granatum]OWM83716.1 hypothetical protein CDL15_Pgr004146 [Punica granatum]PKI75319.1 hypothetical protein CRG98_004359 [Punica granatum]